MFNSNFLPKLASKSQSFDGKSLLNAERSLTSDLVGFLLKHNPFDEGDLEKAQQPDQLE